MTSGESLREAVEGFEDDQAARRGEIAPALPPSAWEAIQRNEFEKTSLAWTLMTDTMRGAKTPGIASGSHAIAALALHDSPRGFTHEDVRVLREKERGFADETTRMRDDFYRSLADRIAALLPPEGA